MSLSGAFEKPYDPSEFEEKRAQDWIDKGFFASQPKSDTTHYTIVIPPPNVTGDLHIGHVLNNTLQDILIRWQRLKGRETCWVPGTDHASIATEAKVTKKLADEGINKRELGREKFLEEAYKWKSNYGGRIIGALKRLGASCDWDREVFTMDPDYHQAVLQAFVTLYDQGLVYKGHRLVNWCPVSQSVISDEEVISEERQGHLWHISYPVVSPTPGGPTAVEVATTRPETLFGDLAVAVHPEDERYQGLIGQKVRVPVCDREVPVIADTYVERDFGTGVVKITPAHDMNDYEVGQRHNLGLLNVMNPDASLNENSPPAYQGLDRYEARQKLVKELKERGLLVKTDNHKMVVGISERGHVPIEFYLSEQWYFKMEGLAQLALEETRSGRLRLLPAFTEKIWEHWLGGIKDWCVSRQLWWGHRIPVYTCTSCSKVHCAVEAPAACEACGHVEFEQEEDVLDTWASSWLWPFAVQGWPKNDAQTQKQMEAYYPTETIVTGQDIIFFWIARMVMAGKHFTGKLPFKSVYFTPIVRDSKGRKMSKSLGNSPDLQKLMAEYGTDALRFSLVNQIVLGQDIHWKNESCEMGRNFANKIWNATRFLLSHAEKRNISSAKCTFESLKIPNDAVATWLFSEFCQTLETADKALSGMNFATYSSKLYEHLWMVFCDWFVELLKPVLAEAAETNASVASLKRADELLQFALSLFDGALRLLHPLMPFVTEEIWQRLAEGRSSQTIGRQLWPNAKELTARYEPDPASVAHMRAVQGVVGAVRAIRGQYSLHPGLRLRVVLPEASRDRFGEHVAAMEYLSGSQLHFEDALPQVVGAALTQGTEVFVDLEGHVDAASEVKSVKQRLQKIEQVLVGIQKKLSNEKFVSGAPESVVAGARAQESENLAEKKLLNRVLESMQSQGG